MDREEGNTLTRQLHGMSLHIHFVSAFPLFAAQATYDESDTYRPSRRTRGTVVIWWFCVSLVSDIGYFRRHGFFLSAQLGSVFHASGVSGVWV